MEVWSPVHDEIAARMDLYRLKARIGRGEVINESDLQWETYIKAKADGDLTNIVKYNFVMATVKNDAVGAKDDANKGVESTVPKPGQQPAELPERSRGREDNENGGRATKKLKLDDDEQSEVRRRGLKFSGLGLQCRPVGKPFAEGIAVSLRQHRARQWSQSRIAYRMPQRVLVPADVIIRAVYSVASMKLKSEGSRLPYLVCAKSPPGTIHDPTTPPL